MEREKLTFTNRHFRILFVGGVPVAQLGWDGPLDRAYIWYVKDSNPQCVPFEMEKWPPTEDDVKRADIVLAMLKG